MYNIGVGARLQVQKTEDLDKEREVGLPKTTLDTELKVNAKLYDTYTPCGLIFFLYPALNLCILVLSEEKALIYLETSVSFIPFFDFGFWSILAMKL